MPLVRPHGQFEGLHHGWSRHLRHALTSFGSPWRGLISVDPALLARFAGPEAAAATATLEQVIAMRNAASGRDRAQLDMLAQWMRETGYRGVVVSRQRHDNIRSYLRHERIHQQVSRHATGFDLAQPHQQVLARYQDLTRAFVEGVKPDYADTPEGWSAAIERGRQIRSFYEKDMRDYLRRTGKSGAEIEAATRAHIMDEALAYSQMHNRRFFRAMEAAGLPDPRKRPLRQMREAAMAAARQLPALAASPHATPQATRSAGWVRRLGSILRSVL